MQEQHATKSHRHSDRLRCRVLHPDKDHVPLQVVQDKDMHLLQPLLHKEELLSYVRQATDISPPLPAYACGHAMQRFGQIVLLDVGPKIDPLPCSVEYL